MIYGKCRMEQKMKPITKQLAIGAFILTLVTVLSFGVRQVRFSAYRAGSGQSTPSDRPSSPENQPKSKQSLRADAEPDHYPDDSYIIDDEQDLQYADTSDWDEQARSDDYSEEYTDSSKQGKAVSMTKSFKGDYAKSGGSKGLQKISLGEYENLFITEKGEYWYTSEQPDGKTVKMQVQIDDATGELIAVAGGYYSKSEGSQEPQRISVGDNEDIYIIGEDELWYVGEQPDGSTIKVQLQPE